MGAGFSLMNGVTVIQTSQGLAEYLSETRSDVDNAGVVIGHDGRHNSDKFARLAAAAFIAKGIKVWWYSQLVHTPMVPFAVEELGAAAGVMVTASHNPAMDNGYKVYASKGCQIVPPMDEDIAESITRNLEPLTWHIPENTPLLIDVFTIVKGEYHAAVEAYLQPGRTKALPRFVYTPMHGVGLPFFKSMLEPAGGGTISKSLDVSTMIVVKEQANPDPDFSTVNYPNPEESGALDLAKAYADQNQIGLILANDPDADRFAAAERIGSEWRQFTGDQMGVLLGYYILSTLQESVSKNDTMLVSAVSSSMLGQVAASEGFTVEETLTGFKWLGNRALDLQRQGKRVHFAYEEALGYMFPSIVHDKDGIVAAGVFLNACARWGSPWAKLQEIHEKYGHFVTMNTYWRSPDASKTLATFHSIREKRPGGDQDLLLVGGKKVQRWRDLSTGFDDGVADHRAGLPSSPDTLMITCWLGSSGKSDGTRFTVRASGTEPKIKRELFSPSCICIQTGLLLLAL